MVTSTHIVGKVYFAFYVNVPDKATLLATIRASGLVATFVFLKYKSILSHNNIAFNGTLTKTANCNNCKVQRKSCYCSFSYSPRFTFLIILSVARPTKAYITDLSDKPTSFPA